MSRKIKYDINFKKLVVTEVIDKGLSSEKACHRFGIDESMVRKWVSFFKEHGLEWLRPFKTSIHQILRLK